MVVYDSASIYIESATSIREKITRINTIIDALITTATTAASDDNITEYHLDDGQTKIRATYRGAAAVFKSIENFERLKTYYINKINPRMVRLVDSKNFRTK